MDLEFVDAELLKEHPGNPKQHTELQLQHISNSLSHFGWTQPIVVDENNTILIGHGRWKSAGKTKVPVRRLKGLSESAKTALMLVDNSTNMETGFEVSTTEQILEVLQQQNFPVEQLGLIAQLLGETGKRAEDPNKLQESYKRYLEGETKRLVLYFTPEECAKVEKRIDALMTNEQIPMRCDLTLNMMLEYEREHGLL